MTKIHTIGLHLWFQNFPLYVTICLFRETKKSMTTSLPSSTLCYHLQKQRNPCHHPWSKKLTSYISGFKTFHSMSSSAYSQKQIMKTVYIYLASKPPTLPVSLCLCPTMWKNQKQYNDKMTPWWCCLQLSCDLPSDCYSFLSFVRVSHTWNQHPSLTQEYS